MKKRNMRKRTYLATSVAAIALALIFISWGSTGHYKISSMVYLSFNNEMDAFNQWTSYLADHASDADNRKSSDPTESPKHYIDIDNYAEFVSSGSISQSFDEVISKHGSSFVYDNGILPWATLASYDSLRECMKRYDWVRAKLFAADLGHYVADGHMPLHITKNYNGQLTGNTGIHSRYESTMINANVGKISFQGTSVNAIDNVSEYVFTYIYKNFRYVDSVIAADNYAKSISSNTSSTEYKNALWEKTKNYTAMFFNDASHALSELIYNAWLEAGKPNLNSNGTAQKSVEKDKLVIFPNPASKEVFVEFSATTSGTISIKTLSGQNVMLISPSLDFSGNSFVKIETSSLPKGIYLLELETAQAKSTQKLLIQ